MIKRWAGMAIALLLWTTGAPAEAVTRQFFYTLETQETNFAALMQQAEQIARQVADRSFAADPTLSQVTVQIIGDHNGLQAPLLSVTLTRNDWQNGGEMQIRDFGGSPAVLLGLLPTGDRPAPALSSRLNEVIAANTDIEPNFYD